MKNIKHTDVVNLIWIFVWILVSTSIVFHAPISYAGRNIFVPTGTFTFAGLTVVPPQHQDANQTQVADQQTTTQPENQAEVVPDMEYRYQAEEIEATLYERAREDGLLQERLLIGRVILMHPLTLAPHTRNNLIAELFFHRRVNNYERTLLIPLDICNGHWVGLIICYDAKNNVKKILYIDSHRLPISSELEEVLQTLYGEKVKVETLDGLIQTDCYACGPLTVENLLLAVKNLLLVAQGQAQDQYCIYADSIITAKIRRHHIQLLRTNRPGFNVNRMMVHSNSLLSSPDTAEASDKEKQSEAQEPSHKRSKVENDSAMRLLEELHADIPDRPHLKKFIIDKNNSAIERIKLIIEMLNKGMVLSGEELLAAQRLLVDKSADEFLHCELTLKMLDNGLALGEQGLTAAQDLVRDKDISASDRVELAIRMLDRNLVSKQDLDIMDELQMLTQHPYINLYLRVTLALKILVKGLSLYEDDVQSLTNKFNYQDTDINTKALLIAINLVTNLDVSPQEIALAQEMVRRQDIHINNRARLAIMMFGRAFNLGDGWVELVQGMFRSPHVLIDNRAIIAARILERELNLDVGGVELAQGMIRNQVININNRVHLAVIMLEKKIDLGDGWVELAQEMIRNQDVDITNRVLLASIMLEKDLILDAGWSELFQEMIINQDADINIRARLAVRMIERDIELGAQGEEIVDHMIMDHGNGISTSKRLLLKVKMIEKK